MHLKVFVKLKKTLKTLSSGQKNPKKPKKIQKTQKTQKKTKKKKKTKKTHWAGFFLKTRVFSNPDPKGPGKHDPCPDKILLSTGYTTKRKSTTYPTTYVWGGGGNRGCRGISEEGGEG